MNEKPIILKTKDIEAVLDGQKTMMRVPIKIDFLPGVNPEWTGYVPILEYGKFFLEGSNHRPVTKEIKCLWQSGDVLWVKETWADVRGMGFGNDPLTDEPWNFAYKADIYPGSASDRVRIAYGVKWRPSIHMPRAAARIFLKVTNVRVERLQEILMHDMIAEGCVPDSVKGGQWQQWQRDYWIPYWDARYAKRGFPWKDNVWVWVVEFERTEVSTNG